MSRLLSSFISFFILYSLTTSIIFSSAGNNVTDMLALFQIKTKITSDPLGILNSWNESVHFCNWLGVTCGHRHRRVTSLDLSSSKLIGTLSPFVGNLSFLRNLYLYNNSFIGTIPSEIGRLQRLLKVSVSNNSFGGEIPANLSRCSSLNWLDADDNKLVGEIPREFGSLKYLTMLDLESNNLTGVIPSSLGNLTSLSKLYMTYNNLIGKIPESLGSLNKLLFLEIGVNKLSGVVPPSIFNLSLLTILDLGDNQLLEGILPVHIGNMLPNLQWFSIYSNNFTGSIPASINNCSNLQLLQLDINSFQSSMVPCLQNLQRLTVFSIYNNYLGLGQLNDLDFVSCLANSTFLTHLSIGTNNFQGAFPNILCNFSSLSHLTMGNNSIVGEIPSCIENLASLQVLGAEHNKLSGVIPFNIGNLQNLIKLYLSSNQLLGQIPSSIGNLTQLSHLSLGNNKLNGRIASNLANCRNLQRLDLSQNNLGGTIPTPLFNLSLVIALDLSQNPLAGSLPKEVGQLENLVTLDISHTRLLGEIPSTLGDCLPLEHLDMHGNRFQGVIPRSFSALKGLQVLDLSGNSLSGKVPSFLVNFPLKMLNLSYNDLQGEVPIGGVFNNKSGLDIVGNNGLCGGVHELNLPVCNSKKDGKKTFTEKRRLIIAVVSGVFGVGMLVTFVLLYVFCLRKRKIESKGKSETSLLNLSYGDILKATNEFSSENILGSGTFGTVYKAILDKGITSVAVKMFKLEQKGGYKSFMAECQVLKNTRHRNLVKVITACSSLDYKGNNFKALVYEYMPNGSLEDWLLQNRIGRAEGTSAPLRSLNLLQRVDIAVDVSFALEYLHYQCGTTIIHCDLKPSNVLLDEDIVAHVGDFGLAKFISNGITSSHANESSSIGIRGTLGYAPPEYGLGNEPSTQGDVYSFGILLMEMFTGKKPTDDRFKDGSTLYGYVKAFWPERVMEIFDPAILEDIVGEDQMNTHTTEHTDYLLRTGKSKRMLEAVTSILGIALSCAVEYPGERMDMRDVVAKLSAIRNKLLGTRLPRQRQLLAGEQ